MTQGTREIELKLEVDADALEELKAAPAPLGYTVDPPRTRDLRSIYFDTADLDLYRAKWSLRVRQVGADWIQTVKSGTSVSGGLSMPKEQEAEVSAPAPDLTRIQDRTLQTALWKQIDGKQVDPVFETRMQRTTRIFRTEEGAEIEMALDAGEVRTRTRTLPLFEAELELKRGQVGDLFALASALNGTSIARFSALSKAQRGYALMRGDDITCRPVGAGRVELSRKTDTAESALRAILRSCLAQIAANRDATLEVDDPEAVHQMRVGLRRLRSALKVHRDLLPIALREDLDERARLLATRLGQLRDLDVLVDEIIAPVLNQIPADVAAARLAAVVDARRKAVRKALRTELRAPEVNRLLFALGSLAEAETWPCDPMDADAAAALQEALAMPARDHARRALEKRWKAVAHLGQRIDELTLEERHDMRKRLKKLRYAVEFFQPLFPAKQSAPFIATLKTLQDVFGYLNDVVMAAKLAPIAQEKRGEGAKLSLAAGFIMGWHEYRAESEWTRARALWDKSRQSRKFWRN